MCFGHPARWTLASKSSACDVSTSPRRAQFDAEMHGDLSDPERLRAGDLEIGASKEDQGPKEWLSEDPGEVCADACQVR